MSFVNAQTSNSTASPRSVTLPGSLAIGNRLVAELSVFSNTAFTWPTDWNVFVSSNFSGGSARCEIAYFNIDDQAALDTLAGGTISVTTGTGVGSAIVTQITDVDLATAPEGAANTPANPAPDPPSLNPAGWDTEATFWMAHLAHRNNTTAFVTSAPSSYTNLTQDNKNDDATFGLGQASASRVATAASEDPGSFTNIASSFQVAFTTAHRPTQLIPITLTADAKSKTYGDSDPTLTFSLTSGSLEGGDSLTGTPSRNAGEAVGTHTITQGTASVTNAELYDITWVGANLTVNARAITITVDNKSKIEGAADPTLTASVTSGALQFDDALNAPAGLEREVGETPGEYDITFGANDRVVSDPHAGDDANYSITVVPGILTISEPVAGRSTTALSIGLGI